MQHSNATGSCQCRQHITLFTQTMTQQEGEWSQVSRKRGRIRHVPKPKTDMDESKENGLGIRPNPKPEFSVSDIHKHHDTARQEWQISDCWKTLKDLLATALSESNHPAITKAICFGPGPYDPTNGSFAARRTAHMQTAAFCAIVDFLGRYLNGLVPCENKLLMLYDRISM